MIIKLVIIGIIIFSGFSLINFILKKAIFSKRIQHHLDYLMPSIELLVWIAFISWVVLDAYQERKFYLLFFLALSFILFIVPTFVMIRDLVFGIIMKALNKVVEGAVIEIDGVKGTIVKAGLIFVNMEDAQGVKKSIGYYTLRSRVISILGENQALEKLDLIFDLPVKGSVNELIDKLKFQLLSTPWVAVSNPPIIEDIKQDNDMLHIIVGIYTLDKKYEEPIRSMVKKNWELE